MGKRGHRQGLNFPERRARQDLTEWHEVSGPIPFRERFTPEALAGQTPAWPFRFVVVREQWDFPEDGAPQRTIHEIEVPG